MLSRERIVCFAAKWRAEVNVRSGNCEGGRASRCSREHDDERGNVTSNSSTLATGTRLLSSLNALVDYSTLTAFCTRYQQKKRRDEEKREHRAGGYEHGASQKNADSTTFKVTSAQNKKHRAATTSRIASVITIFQRIAGFFKRADEGISLCLQPHVVGMGQGENLGRNQRYLDKKWTSRQSLRFYLFRSRQFALTFGKLSSNAI